MRPLPPKRYIALVAAAALFLGTGGTTPSPIQAEGSQACDVPTQKMTLYADVLTNDDGTVVTGDDGRPRLGYGLAPGEQTIPGPTIEMIEGECIAITVVNDIPAETLAQLRDDPLLGSGDPDMPLGVSLHVHGVKYTTDSDGTIHTDSYIPPGNSRTYYWYAAPRVSVGGRLVSQGTAGYWWYHDHVIGTDHGTAGIQTGLIGPLIVRRPGDLTPDRTFPVAMGPNSTINLKRWKSADDPTCARWGPDGRCDPFEAEEGERVEFVVWGIGDDFHTFHLHGHNWADNRTGILLTQADEVRLVDVKTIGPSDSFGFQVIAGQEVGGGEWMLHCHVQIHSDLGMFAFFDVEPSDAPLGVPSRVEEPHVHYGREG